MIAQAARGVAEDDRAVDRVGRRRGPAVREPIVEQLVGSRAMIPHGDRGDAAQSGGIEHEERRGRPAHDDVVGELILHDDVE